MKIRDWLGELDILETTGNLDTEVSEVIYDSRKSGGNTVFVCIRGARADGHDFIRQVYDGGTRVFVIENNAQITELPSDAVFIRVPDTRKALALLAAARFGHPFNKMISIGVTGTKGKTTVTTMLKTVLEENGEKVGLIGTNGCFINGQYTQTRNTTPESYELQYDFSEMVKCGCRYVIMECSSQGFKLDRTYGLIFDYGVFLNITPDHIGPDEHENFEEYMFCKSRLLVQSRQSVVNADDKNSERLIALAEKKEDEIIRFSAKTKADQYCENIRYISDGQFTGTEFTARGLCSGEVKLPLPGFFNIENCLAVLAVSGKLNLDPDKTAAGILRTRVNGRMEVVVRNEKFTIFVDYAHNEISMVSLLNTLRRDYEPKRLVVLFGCGGNRSKDRRVSMGKAAAETADYTIITSDNPRYENPGDIIADIYESYRNSGGREENCVRIEDRREAIRYAMEHAKSGDMIAVIGKGHEDYIEQNGKRVHFLDREAILEEKEKIGI